MTLANKSAIFMEFCIIFRLFMSPLFNAVGEVKPGFLFNFNIFLLFGLGMD